MKVTARNGLYEKLTIRHVATGRLLPHHWHSKINGQILVPRQGASVRETIDTLHSLKDYSTTNRQCWEALYHLKDDARPIILSTLPLDHEDYAGLHEREGKYLFHVDGLHRLIAWGLSSSHPRKQMYIAGQ
jgi:hypothetical protein